jgi:3-hydroxybutyryl-CoA dehydrogenase
MMASLMEAVRVVFYGALPADIEEADRCLKLGLKHPLGPFELMDLIGLDVILPMADRLHEALRNPHYQPPLLLASMVARGWLGRKGGKGFYDYADPKRPTANDEVDALLREEGLDR